MGSLLERAKEIKRNNAKTLGNSEKSGLLEKAKDIKKAQVLQKRLEHLDNEYNRSQANFTPVDTTKYSNQKGYMDRVHQANNVSAYADSLRQYASTISGIDHTEINKYLDGIQRNVRNQNDYRQSVGDYMSQFKDEYDFNNYQKYSGSSQADIDARIKALNQSINDINNPNKDADIKEREWLHNYYNSNLNWLTERNADDVKAQIAEVDAQLNAYMKKRGDLYLLGDYNDPEYYRLMDEYDTAIEELRIQKNFLEKGNETLSGYQAYMDAQKQIEDLKAQGYKPAENYGGALLNSAGQGAYDTMINNVMAFTDATLGKPLRFLEDKTIGNGLGHLIGKGYDWTDDISEIYKNQSLIDSTEYDSGIEKFGMGASNVIASALPTIAIAVATGGVGAATGAKSIGTYLKSLAKNPQYWASFVNMGGATYDSAIEEGATYEEALASALLNGAIGAATEVGSGFEKKLTNSNTFKNWLTSALEEGGEEVIQGVLENGIKKGVYDHDREWISGTDENAVINPIRMAQEFGYGALAGGVLSGANIGASSAVNAGVNAYQQTKAYKEIGQDIKGSESLDAYTQYAMDNKLIKSADKISDVKMGKVAEKVETDIKQSMMNASSLKELTDAYDKVSKYNDSELTAIATHHYIQKVREMQNGVTGENSAHTGGFTANATTSPQNSENVLEMANSHTDKGVDGSAQTANVITSSGNKASITGIVEVSDGDAVVSLSDGTIAKVSELEIANKEFAKVWAYALSHNNTNLAKNITSNFAMQTYADDYIHHYKNMLSVGRMGLDYKAYEAITEVAENRIGVGVAYSAYSFGNGRFGTEETVEAVKPSKKSKAQYTKEEGVKDSPMDVLYEGVSKKLGIEIKKVKRLFAGEDAEANAQLVVAAASIMVSENADNEYVNFIHELGEGVLAYNPKAYADLRKAILEYAVVSEGVGSLDQLIKKKQKMYAKVEGSETYTKAMNEVVNDILGGMFANDEGVKQFTDWLQDKSGYSVKEQKTFLQKLCDLLKSIADAIKNFIKSGKVNEANIIGLKMQGERAMEIRSQFLKALEGMKENIEQENGVASDSVKFSIKTTTDGKKVAVIDSNILEGVPKSKWNQTVINELSKIKFIPVRNDIIGVNSRTKGEMLKSEYTKWLKNNAKSKYYSKLQTAPYLNDVVEASTDYVNEGLKHSRKDNFVGFARGNVLLQIGTKKYSADVVVGITSNQKMIFYDIVNMYDTNFEIKKKSQLYDTITKSEDRRRVATSSKFKVAENEDFVNKKNSLKDSEGRNLTDAQIDYFKDSQIKDSNGNLKVMYHGSPESFTAFDKKKARSSGYYGSGFYFTESESHARLFGSNYKVYLNITNPMQDGTNNISKAQFKKFVKAVAENEDYGIENYGYGATVDSVVNDVYGKDDFAMIMDINATCIGDMVEAIQLFNEVNGTAYDGIVVPTETVAFYPNQIKNTDNLNPTENEDIRYSLKDTEGNTLSQKQLEYFKDSKVRDAEGNLKVMYHGTEHAGFTVFNPGYSDDGLSLFFTDSNTVAKGYSSTYDNFIPDKKYTLEELNDIINDSYMAARFEDGKYEVVKFSSGFTREDVEYSTTDYEEFVQYVKDEYDYVGNGNYKVYLNITNPLVIEADGRNWDMLPLMKNKGIDRFNYIYVSGEADGKYNVEWEDMLNKYGDAETAEYSLDEIRQKFGDYVAEGVKAGRKDFEQINIDSKTKELVPRTTRQYSYYAQKNGHDGVIFNDILDSALYAAGSEKIETSTVAIAFNSNQVKSVANENPTENEDIRYSLKELTEDDYSTIKEFFGTTNNYKVAGYLLKDGSMLDFSGKHWGNPNPYTRTVDHRDVWDVWENPDTDGYDEMVNMIGNGNIRLMAEVGGINLAALPTNEQMNTLKGYIKNFGGKVVVDIDEIGGDTIESFGYDKGTSADSILGDIEDYFKKGNHQSDLMAFHTKFSLKEDSEPENTNNLDQSEMYKAQVEALSGIFEVTKGKKVKASSLRSVASMIRKRYNSTYDYNHLVNDLRIIYDYASSGKVAVNDLMGMTQMLSKLVLQESANNREISAEAKSLLNDIKATRIMLSDAQKEEIAYYYDSFNEYRKKNFGKLTIANNGTSLDTVWKQFSETHPEWFDADVSELDQPMRLAEIVQALSEDYRSEEGFDIEDASTYMALELFNSYFIALDSQISEKHKTEINRLKSKYSTRMDKIKKQAKEKYEAKLQEVKQADRERLAKLRTTKNAKLEEQRAKFAMKKREAVSKVRENAAKTKVKKRIIKTAKDIISWLNAPTDKKHVPEPFRKVSLDFLTSIDFVSVNAKPDSQNTLRWKDKMEKLKTQLLEVASGLNDKSDENCNAFINAIDPDLVPMINAFISANEGKANISEMDVAQLEELNKIMKSLKSAIVNANKMFANKRAETVGEISEASISEIDKFKRKKYHNKLTKGLTKLFNIDMLDAFSYFDMLGESAKSICEEIREGFNVRTFDIYDAQKFIEDTKHNMDIKDKDVKKWTSTVHEFADKQGKTFKMTTTQLMSLYSLSKREQARKHIFGEGIKVAEIKAIKERQVEEHQVNEEILAKMFEPLTEKQKNFADALQNYMSSVSAEWGNEVSMQMYGYKKFTEKFYFPISSSENSLDENGRKEQKDASCYTIRSLGMTKPLDPKATNAINTIDIFDVFANHIVDMSNYHAFALPLSDAMRWYNYKADGNNLKESIDGAFGKEGQAFFVNLIRDINGEVKTGTSVGLDWFTGNYKAASVGLNLRVMAQQPTAYFRAGMVINPKYLIAGRVRYDLIKDSFAECKKYSAIAIWKSWGYNETMMGQSMKGTITGQQSVRDKMNEFSGFLNQKADEWTWGWLWNVVKVEQMDAHKDMDIHSEEFLKLVAKRFDEVIDETQVVDTVLHKSQLMRDKSKNMLTAFMSEPTKTYNMIHNQVMKIYQNPHDTEAWKGLARAVATFVFTTAVTAAVKSFIDSFRHRDKEEYEEWGEQFLNEMKRNAWDDFNPFTLIPVFKEILPIFDAITGKEYFESTRFDTASFTQLALFITQVKKYISGESNYTPYYLIKAGSQALSSLTGVPAYNIYRTLTTLHNTIAENPLPMKVSEEEAQEFDERIEQLEKGTANFDDLIEAEQEEYLEDYPTASDEKAKEHGISAVRSKVTAEYKEEYINAFKMGYTSRMKEIKKNLETSGLYEDVDDTLMDWLVSSLRTEYLKAKTDAERTTIRQLLWKTGKWKTVRALDKQIEEWRK